MKEHPASRAARVNGFGERNEVGIVLAEEVGEVFKLAAVAREASELGKHEACDVAALDVLHHALGLRVLHHALAALSRKIVNLLHLPSAALRILAGTLLVVLGAVA